MKHVVLLCGKLFDGVSDSLVGPMEILIEGNHIANIAPSVGRPPDAELFDLSSRTVCPGFIDTHVHLTMEASRLAEQSLESSASKVLRGLSHAREYMSYGFTTLRDLGSADPEWPTVDLRNAINTGMVQGPALSSRHTLSVRAPATAICAAFTVHVGHCRYQRLLMIRLRSKRWCAVSTLTVAIGSRRQIQEATSARATIPRASPGLTMKWRC